MSVSIKDVATKAGVSISTVSKVINNWPTISEATAERVRETMRELDYTPNRRAASFSRRASWDLAFLAPLDKGRVFADPHLFEIMCGANSYVDKKNYHLTVVDVSAQSNTVESMRDIVSGQIFDGMIVHGSAITPEIGKLIIDKNFPHILIGRPEFETGLCWVDTNHVLEGSVAARHLAGSGCRSIAFIAGSPSGKLSRERIQGFLSVSRERRISVPEGFIRYTQDDFESGYDIMRKLLKLPSPPDAVICENNSTAIWVLKALKDGGAALPEDVSLVTFDDYPLSHLMDPKPTVVDIDVFDLGFQAGRALLQKIRNPELQIQSYTTLPRLIQRSTTASFSGV
ncbi:MAG: LacI family transcriptional regulator [Oscillospiraceae bacterium]|jgi:DNA-binding LacI/PurR family transcriptional regulator|nr:LacI family transcriptional regulator [Oscillospiraceae bacterium]